MLVKAGVVKTQTRRVLARPRTVLPTVFVFLFVCLLVVVHQNEPLRQKVPYLRDGKSFDRDPSERREQELGAQRTLFEEEHRLLESKPGHNTIFGNTLVSLTGQHDRDPSDEAKLGPAPNTTIVSFSKAQPVAFNPYPQYNTAEWLSRHAPHVACPGPAGRVLEDVRVFRGRPAGFPEPGFGSYSVLGLDRNLCFERETRLGQYGLLPVVDDDGEPLDWEKVDWGELQERCVALNQARFVMEGPKNEYLNVQEDGEDEDGEEPSSDAKRAAEKEGDSVDQTLRRFWRKPRPVKSQHKQPASSGNNDTAIEREPRTALLLRSYTGKIYTDNDKQVIRSLIAELNLRSGGEFTVYLFVQIRDNEHNLWTDEGYQAALEAHVPAEFRSISVLWNDALITRAYGAGLPSVKARKVYHGQFLPVQLFAQAFREYEFVWNWEMDSRVVGHHYDVLARMGEFARRQPRRGLWERNERYYIPSVHGDFDSAGFREQVEQRAAGRRRVGSGMGDLVWGAPKIPVVDPVGPKPPVEDPQDDDYAWGVGEDADLIELAPIFDPVNSNWVMRNTIWGYRSRDFSWGRLPRRATIVTQSRLSRRLLDVMHREDLRGNHAASEMVAQTVALLHGLKAVYAPMPVFFDRAWSGEQLDKWFNGGPGGQSGSFGSAFGWGQEGRFGGATWYYRATPPQRLYNNWMGYEDTGIGGAEWEAKHGRTCLPTMMLHPIKDIKPTEKGYKSESKLTYA
ncbi:hypothetical protein VTJ83DRAFT_7320 [Remersonia thermophila]|uniref:Major facilitator superfamily transporter n=1 Tax=Remersonia thermophila TaxID=72144 RepID=A0ABR4D468_9PEZI